MQAEFRPGRRPGGRLQWTWVPAALLVIVAGCAQSQKSDAARSTTPQATEKTQPAPAPAVATEKPAVSGAQRPAAPASARDKPAPLAARKTDAGKPSAQAVKPSPPPGKPAAATPPEAADPTKKESCSTPPNPASLAPELTPPPPDQPQPKMVCKQVKVVGEPVWEGTLGEFTFTVSNEGEAPLAIRIKPT